MSRELAKAKRCQLLTGSFQGNTRDCPCISKHSCLFSEAERERLHDHPEIVVRREENLTIFNSIYLTNE